MTNQVWLKDFGLSMKRITNYSLGSILGLMLALVLGVGIGAIINDIPYVQFKKDIDVGSLVSLASLLAAIYVIPYIINKSFAKRRHRSGLLLSDIDSAILKLTELTANFRNKYFEATNLQQEDIQLITMDTRSITNLLDTLTKQASNYDELKDMRVSIFDEFNLKTVADYTDSIRIGQRIEQDAVLKASKSTEEIISKLRNYRYRLRSG